MSPLGSPAASGEAGDSVGESNDWHPAQEWLDEEDEQDMDYHPAMEESDEGDTWEGMSVEDEDLDVTVTDETPQIDIGNIQIELAMDEEGQGPEREGTGANNDGHTQISTARLFNLLASSGLQHILQSHGWNTNITAGDFEDDDEDEDHIGDDDGVYFMPDVRRRIRERRNKEKAPLPKVPSDAGTELMKEGHFGTDQSYIDRLKKRKTAFATNLMWRELGVDPHGVRMRTDQAISQRMIPSSVADKIIHFDTRSYSGEFSDDGNFFFCCAQDFKVRMYDASNPYEWRYYKTVRYPLGQWTITDATLSPDNRFLAYSSIRSHAYLAPTDPEDDSDPRRLDFAVSGSRRGRQGWSHSIFGIWSLRFSGDGREIVAGTNVDSVIVYDIETQQPILNLNGRHEHDVNAVCFGDKSSPHLLYSGSDDSTLRVWDRRSMGDGREAGVFMGHTEGLTYIDSKGDGRYVLSNSKDQTMKLWDLRKMMTTANFDNIDPRAYTTGYDYRFESYPDQYYEPHPHDYSVVTFRGHSVLKTLIRCHFSPQGSTNSRYMYSGSEDGKVYVYNLDATLAGTIDVGAATLNSRPRDPEVFATSYEMGGEMQWRTVVRDASWHPNAPVLAATSWNGWGLSTGTCTVHSWNDGAAGDEGDPPVGKSYDDKLKSVPEFDDYKENAPPPRLRQRVRSRPVRRVYIDEDDDEFAW